MSHVQSAKLVNQHSLVTRIPHNSMPSQDSVQMLPSRRRGAGDARSATATTSTWTPSAAAAGDVSPASPQRRSRTPVQAPPAPLMRAIGVSQVYLVPPADLSEVVRAHTRSERYSATATLLTLAANACCNAVAVGKAVAAVFADSALRSSLSPSLLSMVNSDHLLNILARPAASYWEAALRPAQAFTNHMVAKAAILNIQRDPCRAKSVARFVCKCIAANMFACPAMFFIEASSMRCCRRNLFYGKFAACTGSESRA